LGLPAAGNQSAKAAAGRRCGADVQVPQVEIHDFGLVDSDFPIFEHGVGDVILELAVFDWHSKIRCIRWTARLAENDGMRLVSLSARRLRDRMTSMAKRGEAMQSVSPESVRIFISYPHEDHKWKEELLAHLGWLKHSGTVDAFSDDQILAGEEWSPLIKRKLNEADIIILIISHFFMGSSYSTKVELQQAIEQHGRGSSRVIPIIASASDWKAMPISQLQAFPKDEQNNLKPLKDWGRKRDHAFAAITRQIRAIVDQVLADRVEVGPSPISSVPHERGGELEAIKARLRNASGKELVSDIISGRTNESDLKALVADPELAHRTLIELGPVMRDTWQRMLFAELCGSVESPAKTILAITENGRFKWGTRVTVLPSLRFVRERDRDAVATRLCDFGSDGEIDHRRIAIEGLGFLGYISTIRYLAYEGNHFTQSKYMTEKLGPFIALGALDCFLYGEDTLQPTSMLEDMSDALDALRSHSLSEIHPFDIRERLQNLPPGKAPDLLQHVRRRFDNSLLLGLLYALYGRCSPYIAEDLYEIAAAPSTVPDVAECALRALASIGSRQSLQLVELASRAQLPGGAEAFLLAIGWSRAENHIDVVQREITENIDDSGVKTAAVWTAGELARSMHEGWRV
jgi:hypothetical protein